MTEFFGSWRLQSSENFDDFLRACGINYVLRKLASTVTPTLILKAENEEGNLNETTWTIRYEIQRKVYLLHCISHFKYGFSTETFVKSVEAKFTLGQPFQETTIDDRVVEAEITLEDDSDTEDTNENQPAEKIPKLVHKQKDKAGRDVKIVRIIKPLKGPNVKTKGDVMLINMSVDGELKSTAKFLRL